MFKDKPPVLYFVICERFYNMPECSGCMKDELHGVLEWKAKIIFRGDITYQYRCLCVSDARQHMSSTESIKHRALCEKVPQLA